MELSNLRKEGNCSIIPLGVRFFLTESLNRRTIVLLSPNRGIIPHSMEVFQAIPVASLFSLNCSGVLSYLLSFLRGASVYPATCISTLANAD